MGRAPKDPRIRDLDLVRGRALRSGFLLEATPGNVRLLGDFESLVLWPGRECLPENMPGKLSSSDMSFASIALFCFIFKALFSRKFMPSSSSSESDSEWESFAELSEGFGGSAFVLAALRVFRAGNFIATLRGPEGRH